STDTLYEVTRRRFSAGQTTEIEVLQTHLAQLNARLELQRAALDVRARLYSFRSYLGLRDSADVRPEIAFETPDVTVDVLDAVAQARAHGGEVVSFGRRTLEARREVAEARGAGGRTVTLYATLG